MPNTNASNPSATQRNRLSLRKDDQVQVISGREKGKTGKVLKVDAKNMRVLVEKVNLVKRHLKPTQGNPQGGIVEKETSLHYSNVLLMCPKCNRGVRHGTKLQAGGKKGEEKKVRVCKKCGQSLDAA
jgi:large subunit ribosomal protein L24